MLAGNLIPGPDTPGAKIKPDGSPINIERGRLNIGEPLTPGVLFGMAYSISKTQCFAAKITFDSQFRTPLFDTLLIFNNNVI
jgi:hypothetical protein